MRRFTVAATIAVLVLGSAASANAQSRNCAQDNRAAGTVVGAIVGGVAGGAIANNSRRSFRGSRNFRGSRGFRNGRGYRGGRNFRRSRRGNQGLGIALGALAGGLVGNQIASSNVRGCNSYRGARGYNNSPYAAQSGQQGQYLAGGDIDHNARRLGDPYGGRRVVTGRQTSAPLQGRPAPTPFQGQPQLFQPRCETVNRITELPDGTRTRDPVEVCQFSQGGEWIPR